MTSAIFGLVGIFITYKATTDSSIFNMDTYSNFIKKIFGQRYNVVDMINIQKDKSITQAAEAKTDNIYASLGDLSENIDSIMESNAFSLRITDFIVSIFSYQTDSELIIFERFYYNTFKAIINHPVFHNKNVRAKAYEFPAMNIKEFQDTRALRTALIIMASIPPLTLLVALRHYVKIIILKSKLKHIKQLIPEMGTLLRINQATANDNENTTVCNKVPYPTKDGGCIAMYNLALGMAQKDNAVDILAIETPKHPNVSSKEELAPNLRLKSVFVDTNIKMWQALINLVFSRIPYYAERFINKGFTDELVKN